MRKEIFCLFLMGFSMVLWGCSNYGGGSGNGKGNGQRCQGTAPDQPSYAMHIQPIFTANCTFSGCHGSNPPSGLFLTSWQQVMAGGNSGPAVIPGNAQDSLLVKRIEGRITPRMPLNRDPLCQFQIETIRRWIDQGALNN